MTKFDELKERFPNVIPVQELRSNISIVELAIQYGYEPLLHKGRSRPVLEHPGYQDTIIIKNPQDASQQVYQRAGDFTDSGTIIDFIRNRLSTVFSTFNRPGEHEFKNITNVLYDYLRIDPEHVGQNRKTSARLAEPVVKQPFTKEQFDIRPLEPVNYLNTRHIAPETLQGPEFAGKVVTQVTYFDPIRGQTDNLSTVNENPERKYLQFTNVAFPYYNGQSTEVTGLELRNENVKLHAPGSDRYSSLFVSNPPPRAEQFFVMESAIDALSHRQLRTIEGDTKFNSVYFSTGGQLTPQQTNTITRYINEFNKSDDWRINLGFDNDAKGHRFDLQFIQLLTAVKFPLSPTVAGTGRVAYLLPTEEAYRTVRDVVLEKIDLYNKGVQAQFVRSSDDTLGQKELSSQLITVNQTGSQVQISIPEAGAPLLAVSKLLLEVSGFDQRIRLEKSCAKDFNMDLAREVKTGEKFKFVIRDENALLVNGNSPALMASTMQQMKRQAEAGGMTKTFVLSERQPFGFRLPQVELRIEQGVTQKSIQRPEFMAQVQAEKKQRTQRQEAGGEPKEKQAINPENKPPIGQLPQIQSKPGNGLKPRHE